MTPIEVHGVVTGKWRENCYVVSNGDGRALVIDPGDETDKIATYVDEHRLRPVAILVTHAHYDHVSALPGLVERYSVPWYVHSSEQYTLRHANLMRKVFEASEPLTLPEPDGYLDQVDPPTEIGELWPSIIETPGHSRGGVSFMIGDALFPGDTLFKRGVGRVDLPGGDREQLKESLLLLTRLAPSLMVYPGHGGSAALEEILGGNLDLRDLLDERQTD